jgi:hypothetical protein
MRADAGSDVTSRGFRSIVGVQAGLVVVGVDGRGNCGAQFGGEALRVGGGARRANTQADVPRGRSRLGRAMLAP